MQINYKNNVEDFIEFNILIIKNDLYYKRLLKILRFSIPAVIIFTAYRECLNNLEPFFKLFFFLVWVSIIWMAFIENFHDWVIKLIFSKKGHYNKLAVEGVLILSEKGICRECDREKYLISWNKVEKADITDTHIRIYTNMLHGFLIPLDGFKDLEEKNMFLNFIKQHIEIKE
jgi:hypothetical protein